MGFFSDIGDAVTGAIPIIGPVLQGRRQANAAKDLYGEINMATNPLFQPQRQQYQNLLTSLFTPEGAQNFLSNDPEVKFGTKYFQDIGSANFAKSGNLPLEAISQNDAIQQLLAQQYNQRVSQLAGLGGFTSAIPGYLPSTLGGIRMGGLASLFGGQAQGGAELRNMIGLDNPNVPGGVLRLFGLGGGGGGGLGMGTAGSEAGTAMVSNGMGSLIGAI
jgi:hypothetical protein